MPATFLKKRLWHRCFPVDFTKILRTLFITEYLWVTAYYPFIQANKILPIIPAPSFSIHVKVAAVAVAV